MTLPELYAQKESLAQQLADVETQLQQAKREPEKEQAPRLLRMRVLSQTIKLVQELDPQTAVSANYVRKLALSGEIPTVQAGRRLINVNALLEYLTKPKADATAENTVFFQSMIKPTVEKS